jgi:hypothetical protein
MRVTSTRFGSKGSGSDGRTWWGGTRDRRLIPGPSCGWSVVALTDIRVAKCRRRRGPTRRGSFLCELARGRPIPPSANPGWCVCAHVPVWHRLVAANVSTMTGSPPPVGCGWSERRSGSAEYLAHLGKAHLSTLRDIGFANAEALARLGKGRLRRIHAACIDRERLEALRASGALPLYWDRRIDGPGEEDETAGGRGA